MIYRFSMFLILLLGLLPFPGTMAQVPSEATESNPSVVDPDSENKRTGDNANAERSVSSPSDDAADEQIGVVFRISKELFSDLTRDEIDMTIPFDQRTDDMTLRGEASGHGVTEIIFNDSDVIAAFVLRVTGKAVGTMAADVGPATVHLTSRAEFSVQKEISFDGEDFHESTTETVSNNRTTINRVCGKRRGPINRIVSHVIDRIARKSIRDINGDAEEMTESILTSKFDDAASELVVQLNTFTQFNEVVDKLFPETKDWVMKTATKSDHLLAGFGPEGTNIPDQFLGPPEDPTALAEIWLRITPAQAILLQIVSEMDVAFDILKEVMPEDHAKAIAQDVKVVRRGSWSVIQIGIEHLAE